MFTDEDEWTAAFNAAEHEVNSLIQSGLIRVASVTQVRAVAVRIATAAIHGAARGLDDGDVASLPGVTVERVETRYPTRPSRTDVAQMHLYMNRDSAHWRYPGRSAG